MARNQAIWVQQLAERNWKTKDPAEQSNSWDSLRAGTGVTNLAAIVHWPQLCIGGFQTLTQEMNLN